jgi:hypothetical protein
VSKSVAGDADARRNAAREAHRAGVSRSEAGVTTGASKQIKHLTHQDGRHPDQDSEREHDSSGQRSFTDRDVTEYGPEHERVFSALTQAEAANGGDGVYLEQVAGEAQLPAEETRLLLHDLVSVHKLVTELDAADDDLGPASRRRPDSDAWRPFRRP